MVESGGRYLLMSPLQDLKQLADTLSSTGCSCLKSTSPAPAHALHHQWMAPHLRLPVKKIVPTLAHGLWFSLGLPII